MTFLSFSLVIAVSAVPDLSKHKDNLQLDCSCNYFFIEVASIAIVDENKWMFHGGVNAV
jgi:hypothetical protein